MSLIDRFLALFLFFSVCLFHYRKTQTIFFWSLYYLVYQKANNLFNVFNKYWINLHPFNTLAVHSKGTVCVQRDRWGIFFSSINLQWSCFFLFFSSYFVFHLRTFMGGLTIEEFTNLLYSHISLTISDFHNSVEIA